MTIPDLWNSESEKGDLLRIFRAKKLFGDICKRFSNRQNFLIMKANVWFRKISKHWEPKFSSQYWVLMLLGFYRIQRYSSIVTKVFLWMRWIIINFWRWQKMINFFMKRFFVKIAPSSPTLLLKQTQIPKLYPDTRLNHT